MNPIEELLAEIRDLLMSIFGSAPGGVAITGGLTAQSGVTNIDVRSAIASGIVGPYGMPAIAVDILTDQSKRETASWTAWYFQGPQPDGKPPTYNLWNRHAGSGRGEWTGQTKYVGPGDTDIRIFTDIDQCCRDYVELLNDPLYSDALIALYNGDGAGFYAALDAAGFDAHSGNYTAAARQWASGAVV